ncbi:unnamed protein product [Calypogeia fissa]
MGVSIMQTKILLCLFFVIYKPLRSCHSEDPLPTPWPEQFHAKILQTWNGKLSIIDLWYDWPNGRNFNIIQQQLSQKIWDLEWTNGTSYYYDLEAKTCYSLTFPVGILSPDWLRVGAFYLGPRKMDGFYCNVWTKADFITYYEHFYTRRPVAWLFHTTGQFLHVLTFEEGAVLPDMVWQAPSYCFQDSASTTEDLGRAAPFTFRPEHEMPRDMIRGNTYVNDMIIEPLSSNSLHHVQSS